MYNFTLSMAQMLNYGLGGAKQSDLDLAEMDKLAEGLDAKNITYTRSNMLGGEQITVLDENGEYLWDAVLHSGSYGHENGLIEVMGETVVRVDFDTVEGYLTAEEILSRI